MPDVILHIFSYFELKNETEQIAALVFGGVYIFVLIVRIAVALGYQSKYTGFYIAAKEIPSKAEISKIRGGFLSRVLQDYAALGERGVGNADAAQITKKHLLKSNILGWNYKSMEQFVKMLEQSVLFIGLILVFLLDSKLFFGAEALSVFVITRLLSAIFDFNVVREKLVLDVSFYIIKEVGKFYAPDTSSAVQQLKSELKSLMINQSKLWSESINKLSADLSSSMQVSIEKMTYGVDNTLAKLAEQTNVLQKPLNLWSNALDNANNAQNKMNEAVDGINESVMAFSASTNAITSVLGDYTLKMTDERSLLEEQMNRLVDAVAGLKNTNAESDAHVEAVSTQLHFIEANQTSLERALQHYEVSLKELTGQMGNAFGNMVDFQLRETYSSLNEGIKEHLKQVMSANTALIERMNDLFAQMREQSRSESDAIMRMKDQMDLHFEQLKNNYN